MVNLILQTVITSSISELLKLQREPQFRKVMFLQNFQLWLGKFLMESFQTDDQLQISGFQMVSICLLCNFFQIIQSAYHLFISCFFAQKL